MASDYVLTYGFASITKKELRELKLERDILKKAVSIFSKSDH